MAQIPHTNDYDVAALYKFVRLSGLEDWQQRLRAITESYQMMGTILLADEGINGTISAAPADMERFIGWLTGIDEFADTDVKYSTYQERPFHRMKVRLKREIVTMGQPDIQPAEHAGIYVDPKDWNTLITDPDVLVVDTRNSYETAIGKFSDATDPQTKTFREFPAWANQLADMPDAEKPKKIAMYCTGGIRCEKSTAYMKSLGFDDVYHLKGGILRYLEETPKEQSLWEGECFVFDSRVAVDHSLNKGIYDLCHACKMPIDANDMADEAYVPGVSCPHCHDKTSDAQRARFAERSRQINLARQRGEQHIGMKKLAPENAPKTAPAASQPDDIDN